MWFSQQCYKCPHGLLPGQNCLNDPEDLGEPVNCTISETLLNGCETIIIGNP